MTRTAKERISYFKGYKTALRHLLKRLRQRTDPNSFGALAIPKVADIVTQLRKELNED